MTRNMQRSRYWLGGGIAFAALCAVLAFSPNLPGQQDQGDAGRGDGRGGGRGGDGRPATAVVPQGFWNPGLNTHLLPNGDPASRMSDGHPDLTGRYYPNGVGRMVGSYTPGGVDRNAASILPENAKQENPVFRPETKAKYQYPTPYGICAPGGTPMSITTQATEHGPIELVSQPGALWIMTEFPQAVRWIPTDGRQHSANPAVSFSGESVGHWEGDTLVVDTVAIDTRMRNISVGAFGDANSWTHSEKEHVIERFSRPGKNILNYQVYVDDPVVLTKPFTSAVERWSLAQAKDDNWTEYLCTANEDDDAYSKIDSTTRQQYEKAGQGQVQGQGNGDNFGGR
jgi:hypothetical protein